MRTAVAGSPADRYFLCFVFFLYAVTLWLLTWNYGTDILFTTSNAYNEGPLLEQAMRLLKGEPIYRNDLSVPPYTVSNYPPLFHLLQLPFLAMLGEPSFVPGKIISVLSHFASAWFAGLLLRHLTGSARAALVTGLMVLMSPMIGGTTHLYRVDSLAQALSLAGLYAAIALPGRRALWMAALLFTAAIYAKQIYALAGPGTAFIYLLTQKKSREACSLAAATAFLAAGVLLAGQWLTGGGLWFNLVTSNINAFSLQRSFGFFTVVLTISTFAFMTLLLTLVMRPVKPQARLCVLIYFAFATVTAAAFGKIGSNHSYFSEFQVALALAMGIAASPRANEPHRQSIEVGVLLFFQAVVFLFLMFRSSYHEMVREDREECAQLQRIISEAPGPALADRHMGMIALAGKPLYFQPFEMEQLAASGRWSQAKFLEDLRQRKFGVIAIEKNSTEFSQRWTPEMQRAIEQNYVPATVLNGAQVYYPKPF